MYVLWKNQTLFIFVGYILKFMGTSNDFLKIAFVFAIFLFTIACNLSESTKQNEEVKLETHSSIDIKWESDTINLLDLTKIKLQTDSISYKTFTYLGQKYLWMF